MPGPLAQAAVEIVADTRRFDQSLDSGLRGAGAAAERASADVGRRVGAQMGTQIATAVETPVSGIGARIGGVFRSVGNAGVQSARWVGTQWQSMVDDANQRIAGMGQSFRNMAGVALGAVGTIGAGLVGLEVGRTAIEIDQSAAALEGLSSSARVAETTMQGLREVASGSPINYTQFLSGAEALAYMGVEGDRAVHTLDQIQTALVGAGRGGEEMESVTYALTEMVNQGRATADTINQISQAGVPAWDALADHMGMTMEEARKAVEQGQVDIDDVLGAIGDGAGESFDKAAAAAEQTSGTVLNTFRRLKDNVVVELAEMVQPLLADAAPAFAEFADRATEAVADIPDRLSDLWSGLEDSGVVDSVGSALAGIGDVIRALMPAARTFGETLATAGGAVINALRPLGDLLQSVGQWMQQNEGFVRLLGAALGGLAVGLISVRMATTAWAAAARILNVVLAANPLGLIIAGVSALAAAIMYAWNNSETFRNVVISVWEAVSGFIGTAITNVIEFFRGFGEGIVQTGQQIGQSVTNIVTFFQNLPGRIMDAISSFGNRLSNWATNSFNSGTNALRRGGANAVNFMSGLPARLISAVGSFLGRLRDWALNAWNGARSAMETAGSGIVSWAANLPGRIVDAITSLVRRLGRWARDAWDNARDGTIDAAGRLLDWIRGLPERVLDGLGNVGNLLWDAGSQMIQGMIDGVRNKAGDLAASARDAVGDAISSARNALGISSPSKVFRQIGHETADGFVLGMSDRRRAVGLAADSLVSPAALDAPPLTGPRATRRAYAQQVPPQPADRLTGATINNTINLPTADPDAVLSVLGERLISVVGARI